MIRWGFASVGVLSLALFVVSALELSSGEQSKLISSSPSPSPPPIAASMAAPSSDQRAGWVMAILARPLFAPTRRPPAIAREAPKVPNEAQLPRLTGVVISGAYRSAIFAAKSGATAIVVAEGGELDGFKVEQIESGRVTVAGARGRQVLRPTFDPAALPPIVSPSLAAPVAAPSANAGFNGPPGLDKMPPLIANGQSPNTPASSNLPSMRDLINIPGLAPNPGQARR